MLNRIKRCFFTLAGSLFLLGTVHAAVPSYCEIDFHDRLVIAGQKLANHTSYPRDQKEITDSLLLRLYAMDLTKNETFNFLSQDVIQYEKSSQITLNELNQLKLMNEKNVYIAQQYQTSSADRTTAINKIYHYEFIFGQAEVNGLIYAAEKRFLTCKHIQ